MLTKEIVYYTCRSPAGPALKGAHFDGKQALIADFSHVLSLKEESVNIFAGNLSVQVSEEDLRAEFRSFGTVSFVNIVKDRATRASAGFGFIDMPDEAEAVAAISALHGKELKGQPITVNDARPKPLKVPEKVAE